MNKILEQIKSLPDFQQLIQSLEDQNNQHQRLALMRSARLPVLAALYQEIHRPILLLTQKTDRALTLSDELNLWLPTAPQDFFPEPTSLFYENHPWGNNTRRERLLTLTRLTAAMIPGAPKPEPPSLIIAPARALMTLTLPKREFALAFHSLKIGQVLDMEAITKKWLSLGYERVYTVTTPGEFARRGGILDIWPSSELLPIRIELFGDEIDSFRQFTPATQRTNQKLEKIFIGPAKEFITPLVDDTPIAYNEFHIPVIHKHPGSLFDYLPKDTLILTDNTSAFKQIALDLEEQAVSLRQDYLENDGDQDYPLPYLTYSEIEDRLSFFQTIQLGPASSEYDNPLSFSFASNPRFGGQLKLFIEHTQNTLISGDTVFVVSRQAARLKDVWEENIFAEDDPQPEILEGSITDGWNLTPKTGTRVHLLTDGEIFGWRRPQPRQRPRPQAPPPESKYGDFEINDLVVHTDHGIGYYKGLVEREIEGIKAEYLCIEYAEGDQLYVPIHQADRINRYIGAKGRLPSVSRLSGTEWKRIKAKVQKAVEEVADDLLELYARRAAAVGFAAKKDTPWQRELEASFPYIETPDQLRVLAEVKQDMERPRPMDRLICGDVGYGKTEIALRAAFKAVLSGKQVGILVPTTILAQQHYRTFRQRLAAFPAKVEMLSRFRSQAQQRKILSALAEGSVDIIIGTHRLIQPDVNFKDLGLVIIDEEQRFGVAHKEHLKKLRTEVDILTLTATPIPRTLYMALTGVRDISTINTPPEERLPIITHVGPYDPKIVRKAILREIERGGQAFFVHNRVHSILGIKAQLAQLVPEARFVVAHGQMAEKELAKKMKEFIDGEVDVLISTSIIESGLDIPNANTLIVDRADTFGLAQLYQLRGRVGRGAQRAYTYFFKHQSRPSTDQGNLRLETLAENTQLGAGFSIAMRDLEIRGAGDFLGTRQHGHIAAVGLNLYTRLLNQAVNQIKKHGDLQQDALPVSAVAYHPIISVDLPLLIAIPESYIPDKDFRLKLYRRLADAHTFEDIKNLETEFTDRFGPIPPETENLFYQLKVRTWAEDIGANSVAVESNQVTIRFPSLPEGYPKRNFPPLGRDVKTGKNAIWFSTEIELPWQQKLIEILTTISNHSQAPNLS